MTSAPITGPLSCRRTSPSWQTPQESSSSCIFDFLLLHRGTKWVVSSYFIPIISPQCLIPHNVSECCWSIFCVRDGRPSTAPLWVFSSEKWQGGWGMGWSHFNKFNLTEEVLISQIQFIIRTVNNLFKFSSVVFATKTCMVVSLWWLMLANFLLLFNWFLPINLISVCKKSQHTFIVFHCVCRVQCDGKF